MNAPTVDCTNDYNTMPGCNNFLYHTAFTYLPFCTQGGDKSENYCGGDSCGGACKTSCRIPSAPS